VLPQTVDEPAAETVCIEQAVQIAAPQQAVAAAGAHGLAVTANQGRRDVVRPTLAMVDFVAGDFHTGDVMACLGAPKGFVLLENCVDGEQTEADHLGPRGFDAMQIVDRTAEDLIAAANANDFAATSDG
jgi:hypothetical protein